MRTALLIAAGLMFLAVLACQSTPTPTGTWAPPYLQAFLCGGAARARWTDAADWSDLQTGIPILLRNPREIMALADGARLCLGDGSTMELSPGARVTVQEPGAFPLLDITVQDGEVILNAQKASYRIGTSAISMTLLEVPSRVRARINSGTVYVRVEDGAASCRTDDEAITLPTCWEVLKPAGEAAQVGVFCATRPPTSSPTATRPGLTPTGFASPTLSPLPPSPSPTPTRPRGTRMATPFPTPATPTPTPTTPPPPPPPPTQPPPPPPTQPPPPPTDTPAPPPTDTPERPTPTPERGTPCP